MAPSGQHIELGIAEQNLFLMLSQLGLSEEMFGVRLLPVGTVYDPFVNRGLDALLYACYQGARFMVAGSPSGISLAAEGGAHQSVNTPLLGMSIPNLTSFEPAFADELAVIMGWGFTHMQRHDGGAVYLRLSTRPLEQSARTLSGDQTAQIINGAYWVNEPAPDAKVIIAYAGAVVPEAIVAHGKLPAGAGLMAITSADRLYQDWQDTGAASHIAGMLSGCPRDCGLVTVIDGHPATLSWLGGVRGHRLAPLGVSDFGQSADLNDIYSAHGIDVASIIRAAETLSN